MFNLALLKTLIRPLGFLVITLLMLLVTNILYKRHGGQQYAAGYTAAIAEYKQKESAFIAAASAQAIEASYSAKSFRQEINQILSEVLSHESQNQLNHDCINDDWLLWYNRLVSQRK